MPRNRARHLRPSLLVALLIASSTSCGIPAESEAVSVPRSDVPFGLGAEVETAPTPTSGREADLYFVSGDQLVKVPRFVPIKSGLVDLIAALGAGPTQDEATLGISSSLPLDEVQAVTASRGVAVVDLRSSFVDLRARDQALAIAQMVFTLTGQPGIGRVAFTLDGKSVEVPRGDGALTTDALARDDFPEMQT